MCAFLIAIFPTRHTAPEKAVGVPLTPLQQLLTEDSVQAVHYVASLGFILALGGIRILFGLRESGRPHHGNRLSGTFGASSTSPAPASSASR